MTIDLEKLLNRRRFSFDEHRQIDVVKEKIIAVGSAVRFVLGDCPRARTAMLTLERAFAEVEAGVRERETDRNPRQIEMPFARAPQASAPFGENAMDVPAYARR